MQTWRDLSVHSKEPTRKKEHTHTSTLAHTHTYTHVYIVSCITTTWTWDTPTVEQISHHYFGPPRGASALPAEIVLTFWIFLFSIFLFFYFSNWDCVFEKIHEPPCLEEGTLAEDDSGWPCPWQKGGGETSAIGRKALRVVDYVDSKYVIRTSMNTWIMSSIITNSASDLYSEHSKREYHEPHKDSCDWQDWGLTLQAPPPRGGGSAECPKTDKRRVRRGNRGQKHTEHTNQSE